MIKLGFTGTQVGMSYVQKLIIEHLLGYYLKNNIYEVHHGDCIGADSDFHDISNKFNFKIIIHPPKNPYKRAFKKSDTILKEYDYLDRNKHIVDSCDILLATPKEKMEVLRSGTWSTIRYAKKNKKRIIIVYPDGSVEIF